jgi:predicted amidophosphoribosyltransferase
MCQAEPLHFDAVVPLGGYRAELREAVLMMKRPAGEPLAEAMAGLYIRLRGQQIRDFRADVVVPVPMHWSRRIGRRLNSPELLARGLGRELHLPVACRRLVQWRRTLPQKSLPPGERFRNVRGAFRLRTGFDFGRIGPIGRVVPRRKAFDFHGARVLLVDDVLTTGATCSEAAKVLKQGGASWVAVAVVDRAQRDSLKVVGERKKTTGSEQKRSEGAL